MKIAHKILVVLFSSIPAIMFAQPSANFTSNVTSGCNPIVVEFTDQSTGTVTSWNWDFGNGNTSNKQNPKASYTVPGTYSVTLTVSDGTNSNTMTKTGYITVFKNPVADFEVVNTTGCRPFTAVFKDTSSKGDTTLSKWLWDFGNGASSGLKNPSYTYTAAGTYSVSLQVVDANGCSSSKLKSGFIQVNDLPVPRFDAAVTSFCKIPAQASFTNNSTGKSPLSYKWQFGDGSTSQSINPVHTYNKTGTFSVSLTATDGNGCVDSFSRYNYITVTEVIADFKVNDTVCFGIFAYFSNQSIGYNTSLWSFGDGNTGTITSPYYMYNNPGKYTVKLKVSTQSGCADSTEKDVYIQQVIADFESNPKISCKLPFTVTYTNKSTNADSLKWVFGDNTISYVSNPVKTYTTPGIFNTLLIAKTSAGCVNSYRQDSNVIIILPVAAIQVDTFEGCSPLQVTFTDISTSPDSIIAWYWDFGDSTYSTNQNDTHTYYKDTTYLATLTIVTKDSCTSTTTQQIRVGMTPLINFVVDPDTACASDSVIFKDLSTNPSGKPNDEWTWTFGDKAGGSGDSTFHVHVDTGWMNLQLVVGYNGCRDTLKIDSFHYIYPPVSIIMPEFNCINPLDVLFRHIPKGVHRWTIYYGDSQVDSNLTADTIWHSYAQQGLYDYKTIAFNDSTGCTWVNEGSVGVTKLKADFRLNNTRYCTNDFVVATADTLNQASPGGQYDFGDGSGFSSNNTHRYSAGGWYTIRRVVNDAQGCSDTFSLKTRIYGITADFNVGVSPGGCVNVPYQFFESATSDTTLVSWRWYFGDGTSGSGQNTQHNYFFIGKYDVALAVTDVLGCTDSVVKAAFADIQKPEAGFDSENRNLCSGEVIRFINLSKGSGLSYRWEFGDGDTSVLDAPQHQYTNAGEYRVTLVAIDSNGCSDTLAINKFAHVQAIPVAAFKADTTLGVCYPFLVHFFDTTNIKHPVVSWFWDFDDQNSTSTFQNPIHNYNQPGTYDVMLVVKTSFGCIDTIVKKQYVRIFGPMADFLPEKDTLCYGEEIYFYLTENQNVQNLDWDFGDGSVTSLVADTVWHAYLKQGLFYPRIIYIDSSGFCRKFEEDTVWVSQSIAGFSVSDSSDYVPLNVIFNNYSSSNTTNWHWYFGDGSDTTGQDVTHFFDTSGTFTTYLVVANDEGCLDTFYRDIEIIPLPITVNLPGAFTPGESTNNTVKVQGLGKHFKELVSFQIFNRWGEVVFETTNANDEWDGTYNGQPQPMDTYVYVARVRDFDDQLLVFKGYISLIR